MTDQRTCGYGLAQRSALHAKLSMLLAAVTRNLELHLTALDPTDAVSKPEYEAYTDLVRRHRELVTRLSATAEQMASYHNLPMANHDPRVISSAHVLSAFQALIREEEESIALLQQFLEQDRVMVAREGV